MAGCELFAMKGFYDTSVEEICIRAGESLSGNQEPFAFQRNSLRRQLAVQLQGIFSRFSVG